MKAFPTNDAVLSRDQKKEKKSQRNFPLSIRFNENFFWFLINSTLVMTQKNPHFSGVNSVNKNENFS